ncbi:ATP-binding protein [Microtetraspora malaysiensis]|uniref:ATP-binding protein n=1 Tax=Microtetraspora malaysiensis TaxID=161358 RepID=UPI003D945F4A
MRRRPESAARAVKAAGHRQTMHTRHATGTEQVMHNWHAVGPEQAATHTRHATGTEQAMRTRRASWTLLPEASSTPTARRLVRTQLGGWGCGEHCEVAELLVSELVTNAVRHGNGGPVLTLTSADGALRCEVEDESPAPVRTRPAAGDDEGGRGLLLVDALSSSWGTGRTGRGKVVWFELDA